MLKLHVKLRNATIYPPIFKNIKEKNHGFVYRGPYKPRFYVK